MPTLLFYSCGEVNRSAGICISFDDRSIREWERMRVILNEYDAKVTFFVTQFDSLDNSEVEILKQLQQDGHEIGSHGALHVQSEKYIKDNSYNDYLQYEIDRSIVSMNKNGLHPTSFAYPYGSKYWLTDFLLLQRFEMLRTVSVFEKEVQEIDEIFYDFNDNHTISAVGIDNNSGLNEEAIVKAMQRALTRKQVLMLYGHEPEFDKKEQPYAFKLGFLTFILSEAKKNNLKFYRVKDLS